MHQLPPSLEQSEHMLRSALGASDDIIWQRLALRERIREAILVYVDGMVNREALQHHVVESLATCSLEQGLPPTLTDLGQQCVHITATQYTDKVDEVRAYVYRGFAVLVVDGYPGALLLAVEGWEERPVQSAPSESGLRGPRDGFIENVVTNVALIRRRLTDPNLVVKQFQVGARSGTRVALLYIADIARDRMVQEIWQRITAVEIDGVVDANQLRALLTAQPWSPFPKMESTERPDKVAAALLAGKTVVLVDNSPFALVAPTTLMDSLWAPDDYYTVPAVASFVRLVRVLGVATTLFLSPLYIGIEMFSPGLVRSDLAVFLAQERAGVPLSPALEIFFLEIMMEVLHEATIRLPSKVGSAATVVGGLIIGQAAVEARLVSGIVVIVAAISALGSFTLPGQEIGQVWRVTKWVLILASTLFGVYGVFAVSFMLFSWLASQDSFGTPYLAPLAPLIPGDLARDSVVRQGLESISRRGWTFKPKDPDRTSQPQLTKYKDGGER